MSKPTINQKSLKPKSTSIQSEKTSTIDETSFSVKNEEGVTLAEQTALITIEASDDNAVILAPRAASHLDEKSWTLEGMLSRKTFVGSVAWNLTDAVGGAPSGISPYNIISDLLQADIVSQPFLRFIYWRCAKVNIHVQLAASRFHQGRVIMAFLPSQRNATNITETLGLSRLSSLQHAFLDPSAGTVIKFSIPFDYYKGYIDLVNHDSLGQLYFSVFNQLQAATSSSTSVEFKIFFSIDGSEFKIPRAGGTSFNSTMKQMALERSYVHASAESGIVASIDGELSNLVSSLIPQHLASDALSMLGLDKPATGVNPDVMVLKDHQYNSTARNLEFIDKMALDPSSQQMIDKEHFASSADEMDIRYLTSKSTFVTTVNWPSTATVGTTLYSTIVSPTHFIRHGADEFLSTYTPPLLSYVSQPFTYHRGGMKFLFDVVTSNFHEGRLDITFHPTVQTPPTDYATALSQYATSFAIRNGKNCISVICPFISDTPWKKTWHGEILSDTPTNETARFADYAIGSLSLRVSVPLKSPNNVVPNVDINVFVSGADDFELNTMTLFGNEIKPAYNGSSRSKLHMKTRLILPPKVKPILKTIRAKAQSGSVESIDASSIPKTDATSIPLATSRAATHDPVNPHFGEKYLSLREMCKRYTHLTRLVIPLSAITTAQKLGQLPVVLEATGFDLPSNWSGSPGYFAAMYRNFRGALNYRMTIMKCVSSNLLGGPYATDVTINGYITYLPTNGGVAPLGNPASLPYALAGETPAPYVGYSSNSPPSVRISNTQAAEFQIPFLSIYPTCLLYGDETLNTYDGSLFNSGVFLFYLNSNDFADDSIESESYFAIDVWACFADEAHMGTFYGTPSVTGIQTGSEPIFPASFT
jgi:hypothetical protein